MSKPVVSVVMPAYNAERTIETAVRSVLGQTFLALELVVCNDASGDRTAEILAAIDDPRLKVIHNPRNMGEGLTRDNAIEAAVAPWIAVIDADDVWMPDRLERLLAHVADESSMIFDDLMICHDVSGQFVPWQPLRGRSAFRAQGGRAVEVKLEDYVRSERLLIKPLMPAAVIRESRLKHTTRKFGADSEFFISLFGTGLGAWYLPEPLYWYRVAPGSMTAVAKNLAAMRHCIEDCRRMRDWPDSVLLAFDEKIAALRRNEALHGIAGSLRRGSLLEALRHVWSSPGVLAILPRRVLKHFYYQLHRIVHGGKGR